MHKGTLRTLAVWLCVCIIALAGCGPAAPAGHSESDLSALPGMEELTTSQSQVYTPPGILSPQETVEAYLAQLYRAYATNTYIDISSIVSMDEEWNRNVNIWLQTLLQRRRLLQENNLCYVETRQFPYQITWLTEEELEDDRLDFWRRRATPEELSTAAENARNFPETTVHFVITGEPGKAYPPMLALNTQQTIHLREVNGQWQVLFHYYPGAVRRFRFGQPPAVPDEAAMLAALKQEFAPAPAAAPSEPASAGALAYTGAYAADYARRFTETPNPAFYNIGDWMGNCANFISQCVWYGFGSGTPADLAPGTRMTDSWFAGEGGGAPAWENVNYFWDYATGVGGFRSRQLGGISELMPGDVIQTRAVRSSRPAAESSAQERSDDFDHSLIVVDKDTLMLAQNSPGCFVYYSDIVDVEMRLLRPLSLAV